jgi:glutaminase
VIPDFAHFREEMNSIYNEVKANDHGNIATYIPELAKVKPDLWGVAICTVDGQRLELGDSNTKFTIQSAGKCLNYALALDQLTAEMVHKYVGQEQSGTQFNSISLNDQGKPHNPMINSGAIVLCSLLERGKAESAKIRFVTEAYENLCGGDSIGISASTYASEKGTADRNYAIAYLLKERQAFPPDCPPLKEVLDFYFHLCSIEITANTGAVMAATLANGGFCPTTGYQVLSAEAVKNSLSLMLSCGLYDYSGQWAFSIGLPAKSGVSGCILVVVPNVMGICLFSPRLDHHGNSVRGVHFCKELVQRFAFHHYDLAGWQKHPSKKFPAVANFVLNVGQLAEVLDSAAHGDVATLQGYFLRGFDLNDCDYDNRTALHLAAAEGQVKVIAFLLGKVRVSHSPVDRFGMTPLDEAIKRGNDEIVELLKKAGAVQKTVSLY